MGDDVDRRLVLRLGMVEHCQHFPVRQGAELRRAQPTRPVKNLGDGKFAHPGDAGRIEPQWRQIDPARRAQIGRVEAAVPGNAKPRQCSQSPVIRPEIPCPERHRIGCARRRQQTPRPADQRDLIILAEIADILAQPPIHRRPG